MLDAIRRRAGSWVVKLLFLVLVLSFGVWGIADVVSPGRGGDWAAEVAGEPIQQAAFQEEYQDTLRRVSRAFGGRIDAQQAEALGLRQTVLNRMIDGALIDRAAADLGIVVGDDTIRDIIRADANFHNSQGQFDPELFRTLLQQNGFTEQRYTRLLRRELQREQLVDSLTGGVAPPRALVETIQNYRGERRTADFVVVSATGDTAVPAPDEPTLRQFHQDFPGLFTAPEVRAISVVVLASAELADQQAVSEDELRAAYQERLGEFTRPERRRFRQAVFTDEAKAKQARDRVTQGATLAAAAAAAEAGGSAAGVAELGPVARDQIPEELAGAVFDQPKGQLSQPVPSPLGWHLIEVTAVEAPAVETFAEVRERLAGQMKREKAADELVGLGHRLEDALGRGATLDEAAAELALRLRRIEAIDAGGRDAAGTPVPDLPEGLVATAFETAQGTESALVEADRDTSYVVRVDQVTPSAVRTFEAARAQVEDAWRQQQRDDRARQRADQVAEKVRGGATLAAASGATPTGTGGARVQTTPPFTRGGEGAPEGVTAPLIEALFAAKPGEVVVVRTDDGYAVAKLSSILPPVAAAAAATAIRDDLQQGMRGDVLAQLTGQLRSRYPVRLNPRAFDQAL